MTYDLAKKLKDVGFPQPYLENTNREPRYYLGDGIVQMNIRATLHMTNPDGLMLNREILTFIPTLEDMIGWCRLNFYRLTQTGLDTWIATGTIDTVKITAENEKEIVQESFSTRAINAEIAVAELCLLIAQKRLYAQSSKVA